MAFMFSELRRLTYQSDSRTVVVSELNIRQENKMAPQQRDGLSKGSDFEVATMQNLSPNRQQSDLGTSIESSLSPAEKGLERQAITKIEEPSSDDSGSVQITQVNQESESPLMKLQSALKENGRLGEKLHVPNSLTCKTENNFIVSASSPHDRDLPSTSSGVYPMNSPPETYRRNLSPTTTAIYQGSLPISSTNINYSPSPNINGNGNLPSNSSYSSFYTNVSAGPYYRTDYSMASKEVRNGNVPSPSSAYNAIREFSCRVCDFKCVLKEEYDMHMNEHYVHKCPHCNYTSRTEGRLKRHVKEFHSDTPPESWAGTRSSKKDAMNAESIDSCVTSSNGKSRSFKCKQCDFVAYQKAEFWKHTKIHIKPEKLLQCPHCEFVTEFKHHYEYHIMNHFGRKPFKCPYCNYKCVNKSMLNSHLKSHSSVYQFHCADCKYETKYCHSIKQHLKKQNHKPGIVFGQDGTPCPNIIIDVYGKRRGPRAKKRKLLDMSDNNCDTTVPASNQIPATVPSNQGLTFPTAVPLVQQNIPILNSNFLNFQRDLLSRYHPDITNCNFPLPTNVNKRNQNCFRCALCPFVTDDQEMFNKHSFWHMAKENADIAKVYGINLELMRGQEMAINGDANGQNNCPETEHRRSVPSNDNAYESHSCKQEYEESIGDIKHDEERRSPKYRRISVPGNDDENDSLKGFSPPSPPGSSNYSSDIGIYMDKTSADRSSPDFVPEVNRMEDNESPIDLSGRKSSDSIKTNKSSEDLGDPSQSTNQITSMCTPRNELSSASQRNRRKGKAYKINHYMQYDNQSPLAEEKEICNSNDLNLLQKGEITPEQNSDQKTSSEILNGHANVSKPEESVDTSKCTLTEANEVTTEPTVMLSKQNEKDKLTDDYSKWYECVHCEMLFKSLTMYTMHKGYHALKNPFWCNFCGHISKDKVEFYIHTTSVQH